MPYNKNTAVGADTFHADVLYLESLWQRIPVGTVDLPLIDIGPTSPTPETTATPIPLVFVPILEHLEFVYSRQVRSFGQTRRVILYRRKEARSGPAIGLAERAEELRQVLDTLGIAAADLLGHGDAAMVLFEFAVRYPQRCHSLIIVAQGADYQIAPHPFIWWLHELFTRLPVEYILPDWFLRRIVINYIVARRPVIAHPNVTAVRILPRSLIEQQFQRIRLWSYVYKFSVLPIIHSFDMRDRLAQLTMPTLLINRTDDALSPEAKTRWLAEQLPNCVGYHVVAGGERFFMYSEAETVNTLIEQALTNLT